MAVCLTYLYNNSHTINMTCFNPVYGNFQDYLQKTIHHNIYIYIYHQHQINW